MCTFIRSIFSVRRDMHIVLCSFPQISWFAQIRFLLGCLWSFWRAIWNKAKSQTWLLRLRQSTNEIFFFIKVHHPNVKVAMKILVLSGKVLGTELNPKMLALRRLLQHVACSSLQMLQGEIQILELAPRNKHNVVILLEVKRWLINCTCLQHPWEFPEMQRVMARPRSSLFNRLVCPGSFFVYCVHHWQATSLKRSVSYAWHAGGWFSSHTSFLLMHVLHSDSLMCLGNQPQRLFPECVQTFPPGRIASRGVSAIYHACCFKCLATNLQEIKRWVSIFEISTLLPNLHNQPIGVFGT